MNEPYNIESAMITSSEIEIFFLDDDAAFLDALTEYMKINGIRNKITTFTNPHELEMALHKNVRICIIDYWLHSDINGIQVIKDIVKVNPYAYFIMLSGQDSREVVIEYVNAIHGGKYIEKGTVSCSVLLVQYVKELIETIQAVYIMYTDMARIKSTLSELKNLLKKDDPDTITGSNADRNIA